MKYLLIILTIVVAQLSNQYYNETKYRKVIGIMTNPNEYLNIPDAYGDNAQIGFVDKPYAESFFQVGLRVYAIPYWKPKSFLKKMFKKTNGMFFQGGVSAYKPSKERDNVSYRIFQRSIQYMIKLAYESNKRGDYYPLIGTCLGFQEILLHFYKTPKFLSIVNDLDVGNNIIPTKKFYKLGFYSQISKKLQNFVKKNKNSLYYSHHNALLKSTYLKNKRVKKEIAVLGYTKYKKYTFVSAFIHRKYPIMGFQNHFEKSQFVEKRESNVELTTDNFIMNIQLSLYIASLLEKNKFDTKDMSDYSRYNLYLTQTTILPHHYDPNVYAYIWDLETRYTLLMSVLGN